MTDKDRIIQAARQKEVYAAAHIKRTIRSEARADVGRDLAEGKKRARPSETSRRSIEQLLLQKHSEYYRQVGWVSSPIPNHEWDWVHGIFLDEYEVFWAAAQRNTDYMAKLETKRKAAALRASTILGRIEIAARKDAQNAWRLGITGPGSFPMTDEGRKAIDEAIETGFIWTETMPDDPYPPSTNERALRVYQSAYIQALGEMR